MDDQTEVPMTEDDRKKTREAFNAMRAQQKQVQEDLDSSLEEPVDEDELQAQADGRPPCDLCGKYAHSFEDCPAATELEEELKTSGVADGSYAQRQVKHAALDMAIRVVCSPYSPFRTERASADEIVAYAEKFEEFLGG